MAVGYDLYSANTPSIPSSPSIPGMDAGKKTKRVDPLEAIRKRFSGQRQLIEKQGRRAVSSADESLKRRLASQGMLGSGAGARLMGQQRRDIQESVGESLVGLGAGEEQAIQQQQQFQQQFQQQIDESARRFDEQVRQWNEQFGFNQQIRLDQLAQDQRDFASDMFLNKLNYATGQQQLGVTPDNAKRLANELFSQFPISLQNGVFTIQPDEGATNNQGGFQLPSFDVEKPKRSSGINWEELEEKAHQGDYKAIEILNGFKSIGLHPYHFRYLGM